MKYYFLLQYRMLQRHLREFGLAPIVGYLLASLIFVGASALLYFKLATTAPYIYIFLALSVINSLGKTQRNDFLKANFPKRDYYRLRWLENTILALGFMLFLCYQGDFIFAAVLFLLASLLSLVNSNRQMSFVIPTPFYRYPFEFTVGFRQTFPLHLFAYFLCFMSVWVGNFNLGIFALLLSILLCCQYYGEPENSYYVWIFAFTPQAFIWHKLKIAFAYANLVAAPISLSLLFCFPANFLLVLGLQLLAIVYLVAVILAKYAVFPHRINIAQAILLTISFAFPPFLLGVIPFFYRKSIHQLKANLS